jgi:hypothetical protein
MAATFDSLWNEMLGHLPRLDPQLAQNLINRARRFVYDQRQWSFLLSTGTLYSPSVIMAGTVGVTFGSATVTLDATANTALSGLTNPVITKRQFRITGDGNIYTVLTAPVANTITIDNIYLGTTNLTASYQIYRALYGPPLDAAGTEVTDFLQYSSIRDILNARTFLSVRKMRKEIDLIDPQRGSQSSPYYLATYDSRSNLPRYEMWPHPTSALQYWCSYQKRGVDLASGESFPEVISSDLILEKALQLGCQWASQNRMRWPELNKPDWLKDATAHAAEFAVLLKEAIRQDEEQASQDIIVSESQQQWPYSADYIQGHDVY